MQERERFASKDAARRAVWGALSAQRVARFPFPPDGRIPNFAGADDAATRLLEQPELADARRIKVNPDAPQRPVRVGALRRGIRVYMPSPRLRGGFLLLDPDEIPEDERAKAASLSGAKRRAKAVALDDLPAMDAIVVGSVAVTARGRRCGKGHGYADLEYAILRELGHAPAPVLTTVHALQLVGGFPADAHDLPVSVIVTPDATIRVERPPAPPRGIDWDALPEDALEEMPVLAELKRGDR